MCKCAVGFVHRFSDNCSSDYGGLVYCMRRVYYSTSGNHCVGIGQDHGDQHGHHLQRYGHQGAAGQRCGPGRANLESEMGDYLQ